MRTEKVQLRKDKHIRFVHSIKFQVIIIIAIAIIATFAIEAWMISNVVEETILDDKVSTCQTDIMHVGMEISKPLAAKKIPEVYDIIVRYSLETGARIMLFNDDCVVIADSASLYTGYYLPYDTVCRIMDDGQDSAFSFQLMSVDGTTDEELIMYCAQPVLRDGEKIAAVFASVSVDDAHDDFLVAKDQVSSCMIVATILILLVTSAIVTKHINPIIGLTREITQRTEARKPNPKEIESKAKGEVGELVRAFNTMNRGLCQYDEIRDSFIANASHELRTPLASMKSLSEAIVEADPEKVDKATYIDFFRDVSSEVDRMNGLISTLLDVVRVGADNATDDEPINASATAAGIILMMRPIAEKKGLTLEADIVDKVYIKMNKIRFERVLTNLISNAVRYTDKGGISLILFPDEDFVQIFVRDTGIGIPKEAQAHLCERFYRVDKARSRADGGVGLGLSMVSDIVSKYSGTINVESEVGVGSTFIVRLPRYIKE